DGSRYTGGAHGEPLVARFVWLVKSQQQLTAAALIPDPAGWQAIGQAAAAQLHAAAMQRAAADRLPAEEQAEQVASADRMIAEGTDAQADNFSQFVPVLDPHGQIAALRFVFPPYQVGPYSDGTQMVEVSSKIMRPWIAAEYEHLFAR
ncbi:RsiV family protein, partial [Xanthomonas maliensis]